MFTIFSEFWNYLIFFNFQFCLTQFFSTIFLISFKIFWFVFFSEIFSRTFTNFCIFTYFLSKKLCRKNILSKILSKTDSLKKLSQEKLLTILSKRFSVKNGSLKNVFHMPTNPSQHLLHPKTPPVHMQKMVSKCE